MRALVVVRRAMAAAVVLYLASLVPGVRAATTTSALFWDTGLYLATIYLGALHGWVRVIVRAPDRLAWACIAAGITCYGTGTLVYQVIQQSTGEVPSPSAADALWMLLYPLAIAGVGLLVRRRLTGSSTSMWLDGVVSGLGLACAAAWLVFPRWPRAPPDRGRWSPSTSPIPCSTWPC